MEEKERCDYCGEFMLSSYLSICEDPYKEEIKSNCIIDLEVICDECCEDRVSNSFCDPSCSNFKKTSFILKMNHIENVLSKSGLNCTIEEKKIHGIIQDNRETQWTYYFDDFPSDYSRYVPKEYTHNDLIYLHHQFYRSNISLKFIIRDKIIAFLNIPILIFEKLKILCNPSFHQKFIILIKEDKLFFTILLQDEYGFKDYLVIEAKYSLNNYNYSQFIFNEREILINEFNVGIQSKILQSIKFFMASIELSDEQYNDIKSKEYAGSFKREIIDSIEESIFIELNKALKCSTDLIILPEYSIPRRTIEKIEMWVKKNNIWVVGGCERMVYNNKENSVKINQFENVALFFTPDRIYYQKKFLKSPKEPHLVSGNFINIYNSKYGTFAIAICSDFLDDRISSLLSKKIDFLIVPSFNRDINLFDINAKSNCVKNSQFILIVNNDKYGYSAIYAPIKKNKKCIFQPNSTSNSYFDYCFETFKLHRQERIKDKNFKPVL